MVQEEVRKGPWTEEEDLQLVCFVGLFGDRRWDFIAKVSGLKRTGKSCRLRWVNYLHPGLKRGKMSPHEEKLVLELHSQWGNRWSRIARRLPGRTDNEIKNYWRTHMRKKAKERKGNTTLSSSSSNCCSSSSTASAVDSKAKSKTTGGFCCDTVGLDSSVTEGKKNQEEEEVCSMDDIWRDITSSSDEPIKPVQDGYGEGSNLTWHPIASSLWEYCPDTLWKPDDESKVIFSSDDQFLSPLMNTTRFS